jgi:16S rRNA (guanine527-N7)-methyltransferase
VSATAQTPERDQGEISSAIRESFGERAALAVAYADLLCGDGIEHGMLGPREAERVWSRHILNSAALASLVPPGARVVDLGSGAGLPGIPLAIARPDITMVLLEPMQRRVRFLEQCLAALALPSVSVWHGRAEDGVPELADVVVVRAVGSLEKLLRLSAELLVDNGALLALKGRGASGELEQVRRAGTVDAEVLTVPAPGHPATVIRVLRPAQPSASSPRRRSLRGSR